MERRKILLGSGALFATALAGCTGVSSSPDDGTTDHPGSDTQDQKGNRDEKKKSAKNTDDEEKKSDQDDEKQEHSDESEDIPGFDRDAFEIDSDVIRVKKLAYRDHKLDIRVMVTTTDRDVLAEELRALAPGFERALHNTDVDAEKFFAEVEQIKFTLYDEHKNTVFAFFVDIRWLRKFLDDDMTDEEFADRCLKQMEQA
ncbi:hypothetical protein ACFQKF_20975 [Halalkalicoccus sp. GCM10025322]|uniref:hypothetical protein n=1 Tax=Halalkalicoccus TaxID=332246 RepID=UPI002F960A10